MIGGMVPQSQLHRILIVQEQVYRAGTQGRSYNFVMGLSFITEGAIPFAAADPLHVIPACVVGAGVAGGLSAAFNCTLMAPHGGIFRIPGCWTRRNVSSRTGSRKYHFRTPARSIKEESSRIIQGHTIEEFYII